MRPAPNLESKPVEVTAERLRFGFYQLRVSFPVGDTGLSVSMIPEPLAWGRWHMQRKARRLLRRYTPRRAE